jgi:hypothetical protein
VRLNLGSRRSDVPAAAVATHVRVSCRFAVIPLPWILAATLLVNGRLDSAKNIVYHPTTVVGSFNMKGIVKGSRRLFVHSWRDGQREESLAVDLDDFDRFRVGDAVVVAIEPGALGIPWYYGVYRR